MLTDYFILIIIDWLLLIEDYVHFIRIVVRAVRTICQFFIYNASATKLEIKTCLSKCNKDGLLHIGWYWLQMLKKVFFLTTERTFENALSLRFFLPSNSDKPQIETQATDDYWLGRRGYMSAFIHSASRLPTSWANLRNLLLTK